MAQLLDALQNDIVSSLKKGDAVRVETLRFLVSAIRNFAIDKYQAAWEKALADTDVLEVIKKQVKTHKESIDAFVKANRNDLVDKETAQLSILQAFLPAELSDEEIQRLLMPVLLSQETNFGKLMGQAMIKVDGKADGKRVSSLLKKMLSEKK